MKFCSLFVLTCLSISVARADDEFEKHVRPLLIERCVKCHGSTKSSGGLRLDSREAVLKGGDSGPAAIVGKPDESLLVQAIRHAGELRMPKDKLPATEIAHLTAWVKRGLPYPAKIDAPTNSVVKPEQRTWWAYQPISKAGPPAIRDAAGSSSGIDRFIRAKLEERGLQPSRPADRLTLLRRITYDLTGLPPTIAETESFLSDKSPDAFANVVDRLLASPAYGERWGRHWLDLVRYADTAGENSDHPTPHAWRYRNWVIDAFNRDRSYVEFVREQIAGDLLAPKGPPDEYAARVVATGFLAIARRFGHDTDKDMHLTIEDTIDTLGRAFLGQSIGCARCHDHKYDPISTRDYYGLYGILQSTRFAFPGCEPKQQPRDMVPLMPPAEWARVVEPHQKKLAAIDAELKAVADELAAKSKSVSGNLAKSRRMLAKGEFADGGKQELLADGKAIEPVEVRAGQILQLSILPLGNHGADSTLVEWLIEEVDGQKRRWNVTSDTIDDFLAANPHGDKHGNPQTWWFLDGRQPFQSLHDPVRDHSGKAGLNIWRNGDTPSAFVNAGEKAAAVWTSLPGRSLFVHPAPNGPVAIAWQSPITGKVRISGKIADAHPGGPNGVGWTLEHFETDLRPMLKAVQEVQTKQRSAQTNRAELVANAPRVDLAYAVAEGTPANARVHLRGDPEKLGPEVPRRWLEMFGGKTAGAGSGRLELANWLTDPANPLVARVMVNRIWQQHFGKGLVPTPNDFGTRGQLPSHPDLLDWLATQFMADGWSIKKMHRRIVLSETYQQAAAKNEAAIEKDANNSLFWRMDRRRLSAEELRDSLLVASGELDRTPGGPHPFPPESTWNFTQHVPFSAIYDTNKRSVYLITLRNRRHPFLGLFDGADPNASTAARQTTTVPTQALYFMNDPFVHRQSELIATRVLTAPADSRVIELFRILFQRAPSDRDRERSHGFLRTYTNALTDRPEDRERIVWAALVRVLVSSNEFLHVE